MKKAIVFFFALMCAAVFAQNSVKPVLTQANIDTFVKNYTAIERDLETLGGKYEDIDMKDAAVLQMLKDSAAYNEYMAILTKNGLGSENPHDVLTVILTGYQIIMVQKEVAKEAENLPPEYRQMVLEQMNQYSSQVAPQDIELIKKNYAKLSAVFAN